MSLITSIIFLIKLIIGVLYAITIFEAVLQAWLLKLFSSMHGGNINVQLNRRKKKKEHASDNSCDSGSEAHCQQAINGEVTHGSLAVLERLSSQHAQGVHNAS